MQVTLTQAEGRSTLRLTGRFDFNAHREFREISEQALASRGNEIHVDLGAVDYLDSSALGMLLMLRDKAKNVGKTVVLANSQGTVRQVLDIANFAKLFTIL